MGYQWMNDCLTVYIGRDVTYSIDNEIIIQQFQNNKLVKWNCKTLWICIFFSKVIFLLDFI